ncbi:guanylate kinase, partial [Chloroflexota bacterium]
MKKVAHRSQLPFNLPTRPLLMVLSGPSGVGKDAVLARIKESGYPLKHITTLTTRPRRANEKNNVDYHFVSRERFQEMIENSELLEWANVYGNWYGVPKEAVKQALGKREDIIVKVDIQGAATIKKI